jgi:hypothetical protein
MCLGYIPVASCMDQPCRSFDQNLQMGPHTYESMRAETKQHCSDSLIASVHTILKQYSYRTQRANVGQEQRHLTANNKHSNS